MNPQLGNRYSQHSFAKAPTAKIARSVFNRSFAHKTTMNFDDLVPFFWEEVLPGDTINLNLKTFIRLATQAVPVMDNMYCDVYWFYTPERITFTNFVKMMGEQTNPGDSISYTCPVLDTTAPGVQFEVGTLYDYVGLTTDVNNQGWVVKSTLFRAYNKIWNLWFRDQNLQNSIPDPSDLGPDPMSNYVLRKVAKKHDMFTSALPFLQKGNPVNIPITGTAPVYGDGQPFSLAPDNATSNPSRGISFDNTAAKGLLYQGAVVTPSVQPAYYPTKANAGNTSGLQTDFDALNSNVIITINAFRQAMQLQGFLETDARGGTRFTEIIKAHFNVETGDARLQRPEFLSGGTIQISQHVVPQTSESGATPQGTLAAFSTAAEFGNKLGFSKSFVEHGFVLGLCRARADITYQQGHHRMWTRVSRFGYFWPEFQELGEEAILNQEIYISTNGTQNAAVFGYQERHYDYRFRPSIITGQFRSTFAQSLDVWHLAEEFTSLPSLNAAFIQSNTPIERILTVAEGYPALLCDFWFDMKHVRPMVAYPVPATLGRF